MLMALPPAERLRRTCAMFSTAKRLATAAIRAEYGSGLSEDRLKRELARRFYGIRLPDKT